MNESTPSTVNCPGCGKGYRWQAAAASRKFPCKICGEQFTVPSAPGMGISNKPQPQPQEESAKTYELAEYDEEPTPTSKPKTVATAAPTVAATNEPTQAARGKCPNCNSPMGVSAVVCINCGFHAEDGRKIQTAVATPPKPDDPYEPEPKLSKAEMREKERIEAVITAHQWKDYKLPMVLLATGLLFLLFNLWLAPMSEYTSYGLSSPGQIRIVAVIDTLINTPLSAALIFGGLLLNVALFGNAFGALGSVLLKVFAITLIAQETNHLLLILFDIVLDAGMFILIVDWMIYLGIMCVLCIKMLDLDFTEMRVMIAVFVVGRIAAGFLIGVVIAAFF